MLADTAPLTMAGIWTSQATLAPAFGDRVRPTTYLFALEQGRRSDSDRKTLQTAFLTNGMQADAMSKLLHDGVSASLTFNRLIRASWGSG